MEKTLQESRVPEVRDKYRQSLILQRKLSEVLQTQSMESNSCDKIRGIAFLFSMPFGFRSYFVRKKGQLIAQIRHLPPCIVTLLFARYLGDPLITPITRQPNFFIHYSNLLGLLSLPLQKKVKRPYYANMVKSSR
ncbi:hypothetical protein CFP56_039173 [Quercus suber]|uniref:Uncharacterized protein n=1 Tax=Quercus suber TaxID=58331 RepID=A0AAW0J0M4_QUESU